MLVAVGRKSAISEGSIEYTYQYDFKRVIVYNPESG
jgi:hypothetical protein